VFHCGAQHFNTVTILAGGESCQQYPESVSCVIMGQPIYQIRILSHFGTACNMCAKPKKKATYRYDTWHIVC